MKTEKTATTFKPRVRRLGDHRYLVESRTRKAYGHQVDVERWACSCPAGKHGMKNCWHRTLAQSVDAAFMAWMNQGKTRRPSGMAALQEAFGTAA